MRLGELIEVRAFPTVVQAAEVRALRDAKKEDAARDFVAAYLGYDERSQRALDVSLRSLASTRGGAFFINGVFGAGKSHLLGMLALLCDGRGRETFVASHPPLAPLLENFSPRFVLHFSLDEYAAARFSLEEIFWREAAGQWARDGFSPEDFPQPQASSARSGAVARSEDFATLFAALSERGRNGICVFVDELSLFLAGREHRDLQRDAAFLQFLGQYATRDESARRTPLWVFAALQKTVEEIGDIDSYAVSQISDRFQTLSLSLAHLPSLIQRRLIVRRNEIELNRINRESYQNAARALPHFSSDLEEWESVAPFHPATVELLEEIAARYGSRTRTALDFCARAVPLKSDAATRVLAPKLFDDFATHFETYPDLKPLLDVWRIWQEAAPTLAVDAREAAWLLDLMKTLLVFKVAGRAATPISLANALLFDAQLPENGNYEYCRVLLEKIRSGAGRLRVQRSETELLDHYEIDAQEQLSETVRRFTHNAMQTLPRGDRRIARHVVACCTAGTLPLASLLRPTSHSVFWRNLPRGVRAQIAAKPPAPATLAQSIAALMHGEESDDVLLFIAPPFMNRDDSDDNQHEAWREATRAAWSELSARNEASQEGERFRSAVLWWIPRAPTGGEWEMAREATARSQLMRDPQLDDNRGARAALDFLRGEESAQNEAVARLATRLLREGSLGSGDGTVLDAADLVAGETWTASLEEIAALAFSQLFSKQESCAPRLRVLAAGSAETLCLETLRRPTSAPFFAASHERLVRAVAAPLGVARDNNGRWQIAPPRDDIREEVLSDAQNGITLSALEIGLRKSAWGFDFAQTQLVVCALLRSGEMVAHDARGVLLAPVEIGLPLHRSVRTLRAGRALGDETRERVVAVLGSLQLEDAARVLASESDAFAAQENARAEIKAWYETTVAETELARVRHQQLQRALSPEGAASWHDFQMTLQQVSETAQSISAADEGASSAQLLEKIAALDANATRDLFAAWREFSHALEERHAPLLAAHAFLSHRDLAPPPELQNAREALLLRLSSGERVLADATLPEDFAAFRRDYESEYIAWHAAQNDAVRWHDLQRAVHSDAMRALQKLSTLTQRDFPHASRAAALLETENAKRCPHDGRLRGEPTCAACRLVLGQSVSLAAPRTIEAVLESGLSAFRALLRDETARDFLSRDERGNLLLAWNARADSSPAELAVLLSDETLRVLDEALKPRRHAARSWRDLKNATQSCRTRRDWETAFAAWLDGDENLAPDDFLEAIDDD